MPKRLLFLLVSGSLIVGVLFIADTSDIIERIKSVPVGTLIIATGLLTLNLCIVSLRLMRVLNHFGSGISFLQSFKANAGGLVASLLMINIVGSIVGRHLALRNAGVDPSVVAFGTGYERAVIAAVSGALAALGGTILFGTRLIDEYFQTQSIALIIAAIVISAGVVATTAQSGLERQVKHRLKEPRRLLEVSEIAAITLVSQALNIVGYVAITLGLGHQVSVLDLIAGAAVIAFAASLPISVNGWGIRELSSVLVLATVGIPASDAIAISIIVGALNTLIVLVLVPSVVSANRKPQNENTEAPHPRASADNRVSNDFAPLRDQATALNFQKILPLGVGLAAALLLFFQFPVAVAGTVVTLNLADPVAVLALGYAGAALLFFRALPFNISPKARLWLIMTIIALCIGLLTGLARIGYTSWAFGNRGVGSLVVLGYFVCGALIASHFGTHGIRRLTQVCMITATTIVVVSLGHRLFYFLGVTDLPFTYNFEGFSSNRNAFAFQLLAVVGMSCAFMKCQFRAMRLPFSALILTLSFAAILTGSITGLITALFFIFLIITQRQTRYTHTFGLLMLASLILYLAFPYAWRLMEEIASALMAWQPEQSLTTHIMSLAPQLRGSSIEERVQSYWGGLALFTQYPILGGGIGAYVASTIATGTPLVIHSTYIWVLAEMGLVGAILIGFLPLMNVGRYWHGYSGTSGKYLGGLNPRESAIVLLFLAFGIFSLTHDIAYQRIFWLFLGALLAKPIATVQRVK